MKGTDGHEEFSASLYGAAMDALVEHLPPVLKAVVSEVA